MIPSEPPMLKSRLPKKLKEWIKEVREWMIQTQAIPGPGVKMRETSKGRQLKVDVAAVAAASAETLNPFHVSLASATTVTVNPGYLAGNAPTINGTAINTTPRPQLTISASGTQVVYLKLKVTLTVANNFVYKAEFDTATIAVASALPSPVPTTGEYYLRLATFVNGVKQTPQPVLVNLVYYIADTLDGTSEAACTFDGA